MRKLLVVLFLLVCCIYFSEQAPSGQVEHDSAEDKDHQENHDGKYDDQDDLKKDDGKGQDDDCNHDDKDDKGIRKCNRGRRKFFIVLAVIILVLVCCIITGVCIYKCKQRRKQVSDSLTNLQEKKVTQRADHYVVPTQYESTTKPPLEGPIIAPSPPPETPTSPPPPYEKY